MSPADWELWRHAGMVTLKQAVFLTMNLEPIGGCIDDDAISKEYHKRFSIASSWRDELPHTEGINSAASYWRVNLKQFGFIAQSRGWKLPVEFPVSDESPQDAPALVDDSQAKRRAYTQERDAHLAAVVDEIEARAKELNHPFDRAEWPGTKAEFMAFLHWKDGRLACRLPDDNDRLSDELRPLGVTFLPGNNKGKGLRFYRALYPDYRPA